MTREIKDARFTELLLFKFKERCKPHTEREHFWCTEELAMQLFDSVIISLTRSNNVLDPDAMDIDYDIVFDLTPIRL